MTEPVDNAGKDFIRQIVAEDIAAGKHGGRVVTRFPPEPNGYLHVGHAKSICLNFGIAGENGGQCFLRLDDTNPVKEDQEYVDAIIEGVRWLGFDWGERLTHASDYFAQIHDSAVQLIRSGKAYVDSLSAEQIREYRGTLTQPGRNSPDRDRSVADNLGLVRAHAPWRVCRRAVRAAREDRHGIAQHQSARSHAVSDPQGVITSAPAMRGAFTRCMTSPTRISDALEGITHSICTLEFEDHRPLYEWILDQFDLPTRPRQYEFSRLNLAYTMTSKRKLTELDRAGPRQRLGRPAPADDRRHAPARLPARGVAGLLRPHGRHQERAPDRDGLAGELRAR